MTQHHRIAAPGRRRAVAGVLAAGVLAPLALGAAPASAAPAPQVACTSKKAGLADQLKKDITAALKNRKGSFAVKVDDAVSKTTCTFRDSTKFDSASVVKVTVLGALLLDAQKAKRKLTAKEKTLAKAMVSQSDNASTTTLWKQLGLTKIKSFLTGAEMTQTVPGADGYWGLTQITARDQQRLLKKLTAKNTLLTDESRAYALELMRVVVTDQRWGVSAGAPATATIQIKNGWMQRSSGGWRVNSMGAFTGKGHDYRMTVLTRDTTSQKTAVDAIQAVSRAIHKGLNPKAPARLGYVPPAVPREAFPASPGQSGFEALR